jgi:hypothetical protein
MLFLAGEVHVMEVEELNVTFVAEKAPKLIVADGVKLVPVIVTVVPPVMGPRLGLMPVMTGAGMYRKDAPMALVPLPLVTVGNTIPTA